MTPGIWCPQCGPGVAVDEDGCCATCGATATGEGADRAAAMAGAFPKMLEALENLVGGSTAAEIINGIGDDANGRIRVTGRCVREALDALRAAREAVKP